MAAPRKSRAGRGRGPRAAGSAAFPQVCAREPARGGLLFCVGRVDVWGDAVGDVLRGRGALGRRPAIPHPAAAGAGPGPAASASPLLQGALRPRLALLGPPPRRPAYLFLPGGAAPRGGSPYLPTYAPSHFPVFSQGCTYKTNRYSWAGVWDRRTDSGSTCRALGALGRMLGVQRCRLKGWGLGLGRKEGSTEQQAAGGVYRQR